MKEGKWYFYSILSLYFASLMIRLIMPLSFNVWGPDTGENYYIVNYFAANGRIPFPYTGFGQTYTEFPGVYELLGTLSAASGVSSSAISELSMPFISSLLVFPVAALARTLTGSRGGAVMASLFYSASVVTAGHTSILSSDTFGELLLIFFLYFYLTSPGSIFRFVSSMLIAFAMLPSYHLGTVFIILFLMLALFYYSFLRRSASRELEKSLFSFVLISAAGLAYWLTMAPQFVTLFIVRIMPLPAAIVAPFATAFIIWFAGRYSPVQGKQLHFHVNSARMRLEIAAVVTGTLIAATIVAVIGFPSIPVYPNPLTVLFTPSLALPVLGGFLFLQFSSLKTESAILGLLLISVLVIIVFGMATGISYLVPLRVIEYLYLILSFIVGFAAITSIEVLLKPERRVWGAVAVAVILILSTSSITAASTQLSSPSKIGATPFQDLDASNWAAWNTQKNSTFASDHRLSSIIFGYGNREATWEFGGYPVFHSADIQQLLERLNSSRTPYGPARVGYIILDKEMLASANFYPNQPDNPIPPYFEAMLKTQYFVEVYTNGFATIYEYTP
ncbi:MAG: hypothetical protein KHF84_00935 [Thermoplasmata archaeon]|nr:hypothetical protein [Candidatus Sysuiplasma jiujiangense]